jgi:UDP-GlcNAc3NAcA epimerase
MKIITVVGARPQFIKLAPLIRAIKTHNHSSNNTINHLIVHTGQHYDEKMSAIFFNELDLPKPDYNLAVGSFSHAQQTGRMLPEIEKIFVEEHPDHVIVFGDTNSTLAGALAAVKLNIPLSHIEAGLRSYNKKMPEEINRIITDKVSNLLFCPDQESVTNLSQEGILSGVYEVGDVMADQACYVSDQISTVRPYPWEYIFLTLHRQETCNSLSELENFFGVLNKVAEDYPIIFPAHPRIKIILGSININISKKIHIIEPLGYLETIHHIKNAKMVLTDSGGVQKEAYLLKVPCLTLRNETEWINTVKQGWNFIVGFDKNLFTSSYETAINMDLDLTPHPSIFGNGNAAEVILKEIMSYT